MKINVGVICILFAAFLWSLDGLLRRSLYSLPPLVVIFYEHLFGAMVLCPILFKAKPELRQLTKKEMLSVVMIVLLGGVAGTCCYTAALAQIHYIRYSVVVLLQQLQPIFAILLAWFLLKEHLSRRFVFWAGIALAGAYLVSFRDLSVNFATGSGTVTAALLGVGAALAWGSSTVFGKHVLHKLRPSTATAVTFALVPLFTIPFLLVFQQFHCIFTVTSSQLLTLLAITFSTGMVAMTIFYYGLKRVDVKVAAICKLFWPLSALGIDIAFRLSQEDFSATQMMGALLLLIAIYFVSTIPAANPKSAAK